MIADTQSDFSLSQGANGFTYGYFDWGDNGAFKQLPVYAGTHYRFTLQPPYTEIGEGGPNQGHPNGINSAPGVQHWVVRRYQAEVAGPAIIQSYVFKRTGFDDGVTGKLFHNGEEVYSVLVNFENRRVERWNRLELGLGDTVDFVVTPEGKSTAEDTSDEVDFGGIIAVSPVTVHEPFIDSQVSFGGLQCVSGWSYGYYNITANGLPEAGGGDFIPFPNNGDPGTEENYWNGESWTFPLASRHPPWTAIGELFIHPNGENHTEEHWATRRWTVQPTGAGDMAAEWVFSASNTGGGTGTSIHVLHNGAELDKATIGGTDGFGVKTTTLIRRARAGDWIDFSVTPEGLEGNRNDAADGSNFAVWLRQLDAAAVIAVDRVDDEPGANACTAAPNDCSLRGAVIAANAMPGPSTVVLPVGRFHLTLAGNGPQAGSLKASEPLEIIGAGPWRTVIDATGLGHRLFLADDDLFLRGLGLTGGSDEQDCCGAGMAVVNGDFELSNCDVYGHRGAGGAGGALRLEEGGKAMIAGSTLRDNFAQVGGAVLSDTTDLRVWNSTFSGNSASEAGGAIMVFGGSVQLTHATFTRNAAPVGDAISFASGAEGTSINSLVEGNCSFFSASPGITSLGGNVGQPGLDCGFSHATDTSVGGGSDLAELLMGGPLPPAHYPMSSSAAVDTGVTGAALCAVTGQSGAPRYADGDQNDGPRFDAGAVERASFRVYTTSDDFDIAFPNCEAGTCSLRTAIHAANQRPGPDLIDVPPGLYSLERSGSGEDGNATGDLDILDDLEIRGAGAGEITIIDGAGSDRVFHVADGVNATFTDLTIFNGEADGAGGGVLQDGSGKIHLNRVAVVDNHATGAGGGLFVNGTLEVSGSVFTRNTAGNDGLGAAIHGSSFSVIELVNSTFDETRETPDSAIHNAGSLYAGNVTIRRSAASGAALFHAAGSRSRLLNTVVEGQCVIESGANFTSLGGNLQGLGDNCGFDHASDRMGIQKLLLGTLGNHGGPVSTLQLLSGSPAIDAGVDLGCAPFDQRGVVRPWDGDLDGDARCDSGAHEANHLVFSSSFEQQSK